MSDVSVNEATERLAVAAGAPAPMPALGADVALFLAPKPPEIRKVSIFKNRIRNGHGYLMKDERASGGELKEYSVFTCMHCGSAVVMHPERARKRGYCAPCNGLVCDDKLCNSTCTPVEKCIELMMLDPKNPIPWLPRGYKGELLFNPELLTRGKVY